MKDDLRYTPSDCFETFPFPNNWQNHPDLEAVGKAYYAYRAQLMFDNAQWLTKTYNRFHNPEERDPGILELRELHAAMDRAVLDAYGWTDIPTDCEFLLDYEIDEEEWGNKKKPYRYRWPQDVHDEVLARLLDLNQKRAREEQLAGLQVGTKQQLVVPPEKAYGLRDEDRLITVPAVTFGEDQARLQQGSIVKGQLKDIACEGVVVAVTEGRLDFGPWEQIFYGEFDGRRPKRVLVKVIGE